MRRRVAIAALAVAGCGRCGPVPDPGTSVGTTPSVPASTIVVAACTDTLPGDPRREPQPLYAVDGTGAVTRWVPSGAPGGVVLLRSSSRTPALYFDHEEPLDGGAAYHAVLSALGPDGTFRVVDANPGRETSRVASDGAHRAVVVHGASGVSMEWRRLEGGAVERALPLPDTAGPIFPSPTGDAVVAQIDGAVHVVRVGADVTVLPNVQMLDAAWSPDGTRIAIAAARPLGGASSLWIVGRDSSSPREIGLPKRAAGFLGTERPIEVRAVAWSADGHSLAFLSNHESECWSGGQDIPGGCEVALYAVGIDGSTLTRRSPRAFRCSALAWLHP